MSALDDIRVELGRLRSKRADVRARLERAATDLAATADDAARAALEAQIKDLRGNVGELRTSEIDFLRDRLDPRQTLQELDGNVPILLMPLRIQTRFETTVAGRFLLVRVFPDDVSVQTHDPVLTPAELDVGRQFWAAPSESGDPPVPTQSSIWRGMAARYGVRRAAWIMRAANPDAPAAVVAGAPLRIPAAWTLPERLVFRCFGGAGDELQVEALGSGIPDGLEMGLDRTSDGLGFTREAPDFDRDRRDFDYPTELMWQTDFEEAVKVGMAVRLPMAAFGDSIKISRLTVTGVRLGSDPAESAQLLEQVFESHGYTQGFAILPQGTPTNVTDDGDVPAPETADDALARLRGVGAFADGGKSVLYEDECDGLRLAHALGIAPDALRHVENAANLDGSEAIAMKRTLWAGTFGYYAQHMLWPLFESDSPLLQPTDIGERRVAAARFHFTQFVFARGPLPAIRIGDQPYGILPVSGDMLGSAGGGIPPWNEPFIDDFHTALHGKLLILADVWQRQAVNVSRAGAGAKADARLVDILSQQAGATEFYAERLIGKDTLRDFLEFQKRGAATFPAYVRLLDERFARFQVQFPALFSGRPAIFDLSFFGGYWKKVAGGLNLDRAATPLLDGDVIDDLPPSETRPIGAAYPNYLELLATLSIDDIRRGLSRTTDGKVEPVTALLYMLARHSVLYEHAFTAMRLHHHFASRPWRDFREKELYNVLFQPDETYWDLLDNPALSATLRLGRGFESARKIIDRRAELRQKFTSWETYLGDIDAQQRALAGLAKLPTARLQRLFAEHVDLASYRLDAWITGFVYQRLLAVRAWRAQDRGDRVHPMHFDNRDGRRFRYDLNYRPLAPYATGLYLGAYGWVEGLTPDAPRQPVNDLPEALLPRNRHPVTRDPGNVGLVQAPSLNQATTAAILRAGSIGEPDTTVFNIDLSSARVRSALWLIDGVRGGQTPAALLGYQFERGLREANVDLLRHMPALRLKFPMPSVVEPGDDAVEAIAARDVVNGLRIVQSLRAGTLATDIAMIELGDHAAITNVAAGLLDSFDACSDLMIAESVHQAALGNFDRAGGIVTAAGEFMHVPDEFEVIQTPRSGTGLTHRILVALNIVAGPPPGTPRARLAPALNAWVTTVLGPLANIGCAVRYTFQTGGVEQSSSHPLTLDALGLEPLDLLYLLDDTADGEFAVRADAVTRPQFTVSHPAEVAAQIDLDLFALAAPATRSVGEILPVIGSLRALIGSAHAATQRDFVAPQLLHGRVPDAVAAVDMPEVTGRVAALQADFEAALATLTAAADADARRTALMAAAAFGLTQAVPGATADDAALTSQTTRVIAAMQTRVIAAMQAPVNAAKTAALDTIDQLGVLGEMAKALFGTAMPLLPQIMLSDDVSAAALPPDEPSADRVDDWLFAAAIVRDGAARLQQTRVLAAATADEPAPLRVFQWPADVKQWVVEPNALPKESVRDFVAVVVQPMAGFDPAQPMVGLVIDEWHELVPATAETTGISFHFDAPNAEPPQTLLLAVSERRQQQNGNWTWEELTRCVEQSFDLAVMRTVGPDELRTTEIDAVLPATLVAEVATPATISTSFLANISKTIASTASEIMRRT